MSPPHAAAHWPRTIDDACWPVVCGARQSEFDARASINNSRSHTHKLTYTPFAEVRTGVRFKGTRATPVLPGATRAQRRRALDVLF